jgi:hypothetical protein
MRRIGVAAIVVVQLALALPASAEDRALVALDPSDKTLALEQRGCGDSSAASPSCSTLAVALGKRPGRTVRSFDEVTAELPSELRSDCDVKADDIGWRTTWIRCFDEVDTEQREWLTQGLGGTDEWRTDETPGGDAHFLVATWCWRGSEEGFAGTDFCDPNERVKRTRISLVEVDRNAYRNVELVEPYTERKEGGDSTVAARPILLHAGGAAIAGRWLYVADTDWLYVFNLDHFIQEDRGGYQLPVWDRYVLSGAADRDRYNPFSSISVDGSSGAPRLVAAEFRLNPWSDAIVSVWPLQQDGRFASSEGRVESLRTYTIDGDSIIDHVQGVASAGDFFVFSESSNRVERSPVGVPRKADDKCIRWGDGTGEDLYTSPGRDLLAGINESSPGTGTAFWAVSYREAFRLEAPPKGYPRRTC